MRICRRLLVLGAAVASLAFSGNMAQAGPVAPVTFPQEHSDIKADPDEIYGRLPNGMTYVVQRNATPVGTATIYMRIAAGSMMETAEQRGLAHFIEHMAFNGTEHIKEGELKRILERQGFEFGADANAYTTASKTVYTLNAPKADAETLDTALFIMREVAGNMTLSSSAIDRERGVVLSEERARDTPTVHRTRKWDSWLYAGQRYADYSSAIGSPDIIQNAPRSQLTAFYNAWYRPDQATLIVVGDFDPAVMVAKITAVFGTWKAKGQPPQEPVWGNYTPKGLQTFGYAEKGLTEELSLNWVRPVDMRHDSQAKRTEDLQDYMLHTLLNRRLRKAAQDPASPFLEAGLESYTTFRTSQNVSFWVVPKPGKAKEAFDVAYGALQTFRAQGVTDEELGIIRGMAEVGLSTDADGRKTRKNSVIADNILGALDSDQVDESMDDGLAMRNASVQHMSRAEMNARIKVHIDGDGPILVHFGEDISAFDEAAMKADYLTLSSKPAAAYKVAERKRWPYTNFGTPKPPATHTHDTSYGFEHYVFPNGVVLNFKPTKFKQNAVRVAVDFAGGMVADDPQKRTPFYLLGSGLLTSGGLGQLSNNELGDSLAGHSVNIGASFGSDKTQLSGTTTPGDIALEMNLLAAFATDAALDSSPFENTKAYIPERLRTLKASPGGVLEYEIANILLSGDPRFDPHGLTDIDKINYDDIRSFIRGAITDTPITVTIVGDVEESRAVAEVARTFGALPARPAKRKAFPGADRIAFPPKDKDFTLYHQGRDDQSISLVLWPTNDYWAKPDEWAGIVVLRDVLKNRLFDEVREHQGAAYAPGAFATADNIYKGYGFIEAVASIKAGGDDTFRTSLNRIVASLKTKPVTPDELVRVKKPIFDSLDNDAKDNDYWLNLLSRIGNDPRQEDAELKWRGAVDKVTAQDVMTLAKTYLKDDTVIHIKVVPDHSHPAPATTAAPAVK